ncbi:MAG: hypothetical protein DELT_01316 [Desulfovibrio sp.]
MKWLMSFLILILFTGTSYAHRVNVFAFVDDGAIQVDCFFSKSQKVRNGALVITDSVTGDTLLAGTTDEQGLFRFRPPDAFLTKGHGLTILLNAGQGHQSEWQVPPEELQALLPGGQAAKPVYEDTGPGLRDIVGGLGWIVGLLGLATYIKYRRR